MPSSRRNAKTNAVCQVKTPDAKPVNPPSNSLPVRSLQEAFAHAGLSLEAALSFWDINSPLFSTPLTAHGCSTSPLTAPPDATRAQICSLLYSQCLPPFQLPLQPQSLLALFSQLSLGAPRRELIARIAGLYLINCLEQLFNFVPGA